MGLVKVFFVWFKKRRELINIDSNPLFENERENFAWCLLYVFASENRVKIFWYSKIIPVIHQIV